MNTFAKNFVQAILFSACISVAFGDDAFVEPEQIHPERYDDHGVHYGLPGWEYIEAHDSYTAVLPDEGTFLYVNLNPQHLDSNFKFGGIAYDEVTITNTGRIYLGRLPDNYKIMKEAEGLIPFVDPTRKALTPVAESSSISVRWQGINTEKDYAIVEIGPFNVEGFDRPLSYQVFFYTDGEIQFQPWIYWDDVAAYTYNGKYSSSLLSRLATKDVFSPSLYNGGHLVLSDYRTMINTHSEPLVYNGQLRPGWVAKSFDEMGVVFEPVENGINVFFGTQYYAGGLFAYDHSREHPVVGSFSYVSFDALSLNYGDGKTAQDPVEIALWYFGYDKGDLIKLAGDANYPYFLNSLEVGQKKDVYSVEKIYYRPIGDKLPFSSKFSTPNNRFSVIWPVAYLDSWTTKGTDTLGLEMTKAIAFKFQTLDSAFNRAIQIRNISYGLRQPRSVQFLRPVTHKLSFESNGLGYMKGLNFSGKIPHEFVDGSTLSAKIVPTPGDTIEEVYIYINGILVNKYDGTVVEDNFVSLPGDGSVNLSLNEMNGDVHVYAKFKKCGTRVLAAVEPSYVKTEVFFDPSNISRKLESYAVKDGLGRVVQTQTSLGNGFFNVSATYLDDFGNVEYAPLSYLSQKSGYAYEEMFCKQCIIKSSNYYNGSDDLDRQNAFGVPYAKEDFHYGEDNGVTKDISGIAEASFAIRQESAKQWTIPLKTGDKSEFLPEEQLVEEFLTRDYTIAKNDIIDDDSDVENWKEYSFKLVVNRSAEGVFTQQIFDANGNILYAWAKSGDHIVISRTHYNSDNQVDFTDISVDGGAFDLATVYTYDAAGRVKTITTPDKGTVVSMYDADDNVRFSRDARQQAMSEKLGCSGDYFSTIEYNDKGKVIKTGEVHCGHSFADSATAVPDDKLYILSENFYGKPTIGELLSTGVTTDRALLLGILNEMEGVSPNDVGAVASYDGSRVRSDAAIKANSLKMSSYNRLGQKVKQWTIYGLEGAPATQASFTYNVSGELSATETAERKGKSWSTISSLAYYYDDMGRLKSVLESGDSLMRIDRTEAGTVSKKAYFDKGVHVYDMTYAKDVYGRTTRVSYRDASGKILYSDTVTYPSVVAGRLATAQHVWDGYSSDESYSYDKQGRLTGYTSSNGNIGSGAYGYDGLGRLLSKREGRAGNDTLISYTYSNTLFRPLEMSVNGGMDTAYYVYDPSGNVWIDNNSRTTYTVNALGLPGKVRLFSDVPVVTFEQVNSMDNLGDEIAHTDMAYDEGGQRIWTQFVANAPLYRTEVSYPGIGEYTYSGHYSSDSLKLTRVDLLGGGYRTGVNGEALFPVKDLQGSVRGFANKTGLKSAFGYRPYGTTVNLVHYASDSDERWQSKEFDSEHGKYYFGARYYDPFFGMWISPDPAGQFANPYSYGGDPLNYIDPTGMWALGLGLVVGYDESHGWSFGVGAAVEIGDYGLNASFSFNQDGSKSLSSGANLKVPIQTPWVYLEINVGLGFTLNSYSGTSISAHGGVCVGEAGSCVGVDQGGSLYWDRSGGFAGMTVYAELYVQFAGGLARVSTGYEAGLFGAEGRGAYIGATLAGVHAEVSDRDGENWGLEEALYYKLRNDGTDPDTKKPRKYVGLNIPSLGIFSDVVMYDHGNRNDNQTNFKDREQFEKEASEKGLDVGRYPACASKFHNPEKNDKMWMGRGAGIFNFLYGWFIIPSVEGVFDKNTGKTDYAKGPSYNYGNNFLSHFFLDIVPWKMMDVWFPNP